MSAPKDVALIFVKQPEAGRVKTRLGRSIGFEKAARLYAHLAGFVWQEIRKYEDCEHWVLFEPASALDAIRIWLPDADRYLVQADGDLGRRLLGAFAAAQDGSRRGVVAVGSDVPRLRASDLAQAFEALRSHDAVIGPADDGGYWLIGLSRSFPEIFKGISWSTSTVAAETIELLEKHGRTYTRLRALRDIDEVSDLDLFPDLLSLGGTERK